VIDPRLNEIERLIRTDPGRRGLISSEDRFPALCLGHLQAAASEIASSGRHVGIVTGFVIHRADPPAAETDGPPGVALLARTLEALGRHVTVVTDEPCASVVRTACDCYGFTGEVVAVPPQPDDEAAIADFLSRAGGLTHLVAVERPGPSHTPESLAAQHRAGPAPLALFEQSVPPEHRDRWHNMRGEIIPPAGARLERLFDPPPGVRTIGVGDGGNEIGMGSVAWEDLTRRLPGTHAGRVPCRVATDFNIVAGVSNWGAQALAAGACALLGREDVLQPWDRRHESAVLDELAAAGAVDGVTARREPSVDGLPLLTYLQPWEGIRRLLRLE
jgi:hypothetical protein